MKARATDTPFMDQVHAMMFGKKLAGIALNNDCLRVMAKQRAQLRRAEKWILDDDAVRTICELSHERDKLEGWSFLARLPFDVMWVEFNLHTKAIKMNEINKKRFPPLDEISPVVGYLMYRDDEGSTSPRWVCNQFYWIGGEPVPGIVGYVYDPEGGDYDPVKGSTYWRSPTLSQIPGCPKMPVEIQSLTNIVDMTVFSTCDPEILACGDLYIDNDDVMTIPAGTPLDKPIQVDGAIIKSAEWGTNRVGIIYDPFWMAHHFKKGLNWRLAMSEIYEEVGHIRFIVTMLAAMNGIPKEIREAHTRTGKRTIGANILPYFQHRTVSLKIPTDNRTQWARSHLQGALRNAPRAWHRVKGHWRVIELGKARGHICRHHPVMIENGVGMCEKCQLIIRWIKQHERGTPEIGIVEHTYRVRT
jgi:hypothetical protein